MNQPNSEPSEAARKLFDEFGEAEDQQHELAIIQCHMTAYAIAYHSEQSKELVKDNQELKRTLKAWREVEREAEHGRQKYGSGPSDFAHDDQHDPEDWMNFIHAKLREAEYATPMELRHKMIQACGLAMSAIRSFDRIQARAESKPLLKGPNE